MKIPTYYAGHEGVVKKGQVSGDGSEIKNNISNWYEAHSKLREKQENSKCVLLTSIGLKHKASTERLQLYMTIPLSLKATSV